MIISDLNYLQAVEENVEGGYYFGPSSYTNVYANIYESLNIYKNLYSNVHVRGNFAGAEASAFAVGKDTSTQAISETNAIQGVMSSSNATSVSATNGAYYRKY